MCLLTLKDTQGGEETYSSCKILKDGGITGWTSDLSPKCIKYSYTTESIKNQI